MPLLANEVVEDVQDRAFSDPVVSHQDNAIVFDREMNVRFPKKTSNFDFFEYNHGFSESGTAVPSGHL